MHLVITDDGSNTLYVPELKEHYHSTFGAVTESMHVFIKAGLGYLPAKERVTVFEIGFGTGLNALLACHEAIDGQRDIVYHTLEKNPITPQLAATLNYAPMFFPGKEAQEIFMAIHHAPWNEVTAIHPRFHLHKIHNDMVSFVPSFTYDIVFFDAFAPEKQPEMWTPEIFFTIYKNLNPGGALTTYCVKGTVKRMLQNAGFIIEKLPGPPGKREMLRGVKREKVF